MLMAQYIDEDGALTFDDETVAWLAKMAEEVLSDAAPLVSLSGLTREEKREYLFGDPSPELLSKLRTVRMSDLRGKGDGTG
jgi:hypothetical protein